MNFILKLCIFLANVLWGGVAIEVVTEGKYGLCFCEVTLVHLLLEFSQHFFFERLERVTAMRGKTYFGIPSCIVSCLYI